MPIAFARLRFLNTLRNGGACKALAYLGRKAILDERVGKTFDYTDIARDLVYEDLVLPAGALFASVAELANLLDEAERRRQRRSTNRQRWPQIGAHLIFALPPDPVLTLDEAAELVDRLVRAAVGGSPSLPIYVTIHDPALETPGAVTRHAHVLIGLREIEGSRLSRKKVRNVFARPRHAVAPNVRSTYVAEGLSWPDIARDLQTALFAEIGSDALVDPPAPFAGRHWSSKTLRHSPERRTRHDQSVNRYNIELINSDPAELVARMLRGRSIMRIDELRRLLARFVNGAAEQEQRLDAILMDPAIATFANDPTEPQPRWLTTKAVHDLMHRASAVVDRAKVNRRDFTTSRTWTLDVARASSEADVVSKLIGQLSAAPDPIHRPLVLGNNLSDCGAITTKLDGMEPIMGTFAALNAEPTRNHHAHTGRIGLRRGGLVVVPHAETVDDQDLADLLLHAERYRVRLLVGYDVSRASLSCSLAAQLAETLGDNFAIEADDVAGELRAGLVNRACRALCRDGWVRFGTADREAREAVEFVVCDDMTRLVSVDGEIRDARSGDPDAGAMLVVEAVQGPLLLRRGQWIVYTTSDYATDHIRAGRFAKVVDGRSPDTVEVIHPDGVGATLDLRRFPHVRSAHAITIREARHAPRDAKLLIEATTRQHAWSVALLLADRARHAFIHVDPSVAKSLDEWIAAVARSKPAPLVTELTLRDNPDAQLNVLMHRVSIAMSTAEKNAEKHRSDEEEFDDWIQSMSDLAKGTSEEARYASPGAANNTTAIPQASIHSVAVEPRQPDVLSEEQRQRLHDALRAALYSNIDTRLALARLQSALAPTNEQRDTIAENLLRVCPPDSPTAAVVHVLWGQLGPRGDREFDELELPTEMTERMPRRWSAWDLWQFKMDLSTMAMTFSNWPMPLGPVARKMTARLANSSDDGLGLPKANKLEENVRSD